MRLRALPEGTNIMEVNNYMTYTLTNLYKEILTLPEEKANQICTKT